MRYTVGQRNKDTGRAAKELQRVKVVEDRNVEGGCSARNRDRVVDGNAAVGEGICHDDGIPMHGSDDIGPRSEVLSVKRVQRTRC